MSVTHSHAFILKGETAKTSLETNSTRKEKGYINIPTENVTHFHSDKIKFNSLHSVPSLPNPYWVCLSVMIYFITSCPKHGLYIVDGAFFLIFQIVFNLRICSKRTNMKIVPPFTLSQKISPNLAPRNKIKDSWKTTWIELLENIFILNYK